MMDYTLTVAVKPGTESPDGKEEKA
jgi:hypothetical protein